IAKGEVEIQVTATALDLHGMPMSAFDGPVSFRVVPGDLSGDYPYRWAQAAAVVVHGTVKSIHQYGQVRIWAENAPPKMNSADGGISGDLATLPMTDHWSYATGLSPIVYFEEPTLAKLQIPDAADNRSSPLVG